MKIKTSYYTERSPIQYIVRFIFFTSVFILTALTLIFFASKFVYPNEISTLDVFKEFSRADNNTNNGKLCILIDAGHGGEDGGAVSDNGVVEKDLNLDIAKQLYSLLCLSDFEPVLIRSEDKLMYEAGQERQKKFHDINNRIECAKSHENAILISIHQNKFPIKKYKGFQMYCSKNHPLSAEFGKITQQNIRQFLQNENNREAKIADENIRLLDSLNIPAVLAECGFLSNDEEAALLNTNEYRSKIAFLLYCSVVQFSNKYEDEKTQ